MSFDLALEYSTSWGARKKVAKSDDEGRLILRLPILITALDECEDQILISFVFVFIASLPSGIQLL